MKSVPAKRFRLLSVRTKAHSIFQKRQRLKDWPKIPPKEYVAIADHISNYKGFDNYTNSTKYETLEEAYAAYSKLVDEKYSEYKNTLPQ